MEQNILIAMLNNAALLLALSVIYEAAYLLPARFRKLQPLISGTLIAVICLSVMIMPLTLKTGIIFDTRSIIISVTALIFGFIPTIITAGAAIILRLFLGGEGAIPGVLVIISSALIGLAWRRWLYPKASRLRWLNIFAMSITVHIVILSCMMLLPYPDNLEVVRAIILPVMLIYPIATLLLSLLLMRQQTLKNTREELKQSGERFKLLFEKAPLGYQSLDDEGYFLDVNQQWCELLGYEREEIIGRWFGDFLSKESQDAFRKKFPLFEKLGQTHSEYEVLHKNGGTLFITFESKIGYNLDGDFKQTHCILQDITQRKQAEKALTESERSKSVLLSNLPGMAYRCNYDRDWTMQYVSKGSIELTGYSPENLIGNRDLTFNNLIPEEYHEPLWEKWKEILAAKEPFKQEYELITKGGERKWVLEMGEGIYGEDGELEALEGIIIDISDRKELEKKLNYINEHDSWTDLHNIRYLEKTLTADRMEDGTKRAVINLNINAINIVSMNYGFSYSRDLIKKIAISLEKYCNGNCQLFHTYENSFVFYLKDYRDKFALTEFCEEISDNLEALLSSERIGGGIGIVEINEKNDNDIEMILRNLMLASEKAAVNTGGDFNFCFYGTEMELQMKREKEIERELFQIVDNKKPERFYMRFQPVLDLDTNRICGFEALARLESDIYGPVSPVEFIQIAEKTKLIIPLGYRIVRLALEFLSDLEKNGHQGISVSINISIIQLLRNGFVKNLVSIIRDLHISPGNVGLELTESVFASSHQEVNKVLSELRSYGISISLDDFGTGYSSLSRERELKIDCLKIDQSFIGRLSLLDEAHAITGDIISMGHKLGHSVIAEGVECEEQVQYLRNHGCDKVQGYLISKPLDYDDALRFVENQNRTVCN